MIIVLAIAAVAIAAILIFVGSAASNTVSDTEAQRLFTNGCMRYCTGTDYDINKNAFLAQENDPEFTAACIKLGYAKRDESLVNCLKKCANC